jgi:hypothetical protein
MLEGYIAAVQELNTVNRSLVKLLPISPPKELAFLLDQLPLVYNEKAEDYYSVFSAIVSAARPVDAIDWIYLKSVVDLTWETVREQTVKTGIVKLMQKAVVLELLKLTHDEPASLDSHRYRIFDAEREASQWANDPKAQKEIDARLTEKGYSIQAVLAKAYIMGQDQIDAVEKRIAALEARKMTTLRELERRNEMFARNLEKSSSDIIDAEFSDAAE